MQHANRNTPTGADALPKQTPVPNEALMDHANKAQGDGSFDDASRQAIKAENRKRVTAYFQDSCHDVSAKVLGVEIEHFIVLDEDGTPVSYRPSNGRIGVADVLDYLSAHYTAVFTNNEGEVIGCGDETASITLEPASQIEISIAPYSSVAKIGQVYARFRDLLDGFLASHGAKLYTLGYHPTSKAKGMTLIPKDRYRIMDAWFSKLGTKGERMMRASASTQVSIDFSSEADAVRKLRISSALVPALAAIADNAPIFEGQPTDKPLARIAVWRNVDPSRTGVIPHVFEPGYSFADYADWLLETSPIFVTREATRHDATSPSAPACRSNAQHCCSGVADATKKPVPRPAALSEGALGKPDASNADSTAPRHDVARPVGNVTADEAYGDAPMTQADIEHLLSMYWPDIRLKRYVEIRPADSLPQDLLLGYAALIKGLFYSPEALSTLERQLGVRDGVWPFNAQKVEDALAAIRKHGYEADVYGTTLRQWIDLLFELAENGLEEDERPYLKPLHAFALSKPLYHVNGNEAGSHE